MNQSQDSKKLVQSWEGGRRGEHTLVL